MAPHSIARIRRSAGVLLHVTSLPGPHGIGDLGPAAYRWVNALTKAKQTWWQVLPLNPPGDGASPYQALSAFAGNPLMISVEMLIRDGLLRKTDLPRATFGTSTSDYSGATTYKLPLLRLAADRFATGSSKVMADAVRAFRKRQRYWIEDFALFMALREVMDGRAWTTWNAPLREREPAALRSAARELSEAVDRHVFVQYLFFNQLQALRAHAARQGVRLVGDLPIFVSGDSADVWSHPHLFHLDREGQPKVVAGVPPDMFSSTGQRWGNPLYNWNAMKREGFNWWVERCKAALQQADLIRIDHFRGFEAYWEIAASAPTAKKGKWIKAPGRELFQTLRQKLSGLPFIAEDLGLITPEVEALRDELDLPGMRILQFAFDGNPNNQYLPHNHTPNSVAYTGTHDNDTTVGWYRSIKKAERVRLHLYAGSKSGNAADTLLRLTWASVARVAITPVQDLLALGSHSRMNIPGTAEHNWTWRMTPEQLMRLQVARLRELTELYGRAAKE